MERTTLSVGFADLSGFGRAAASLSADEAVGLLDEAYRAAGDVIIAHGGRIRKYLGDAILFVFTEPDSAVAAARELSACWRRAVGESTIGFRVAIATGTVVVAKVGHRSHRVEDVFGEPVNRAARLLAEAAKDPSGIALCPTTRAIVGNGAQA